MALRKGSVLEKQLYTASVIRYKTAFDTPIFAVVFVHDEH